ncbi:MAG: HlyD family efflux transporter periplasmic adaptor subunit [Phycisphaerales bacterium JB059]
MAQQLNTSLHARRRAGATFWIVLGVVGVVLLGGGWFALGRDAGAAEDDRTTEFGVASVRAFDITTLAGGELEARNQIEIRSELERETTVVQIVPEGSRVRKGDLLVRLNSDAIETEIAEDELRVEEAQLALDAAKAEVEIQKSDNESKLRKAQLDLTLKELALEQWREGEDKKTRQANSLAIERAERELQRLTDKWEQTQALFEKEFVSKNEYDQDFLAFIEAQAELEKALLTDKIYKEYQYPRDEKQKLSDVDEAIAEMQRVERQNEINLKNKQSALANKARQLQMREERLAEERDQLEKCTILAPQDGLVVYGSTAQRDNWRWQQEGPISIGRQIRPNDLMITLPDTSEMIASVKVHESIAGRVRPGQTARVTIEAVGLELQGTVESIGVLAEGGGWRDPNRREYTVKIALDAGDHDGLLKPSLRCEARLVLGEVEEALAVPVQAVFNDGAVRFVYVPEGSKFVRRPVGVGRTSDTYAEITSGIESGTRVLLREPSPGEVIAEPWDEETLKANGYIIGEDGRPQLARRRGAGMRGGRAGGATKASTPGAGAKKP